MNRIENINRADIYNSCSKIISIFLLTTIMFIHCSTGQNTTIGLLDSLYWEGEFDLMVNIATDRLEKENSLHDEVAINYYYANAKYRLGDFPTALKLVKENYNRSQALSTSDTSSAKFMIDACQKLGDYSYQSADHNIGIEALERGITLSESYLNDDNWRRAKLYHKLGAHLRKQGHYATATEKLKYAQENIIPTLSDLNQSRIIPVFQAEIAQVYADDNQPKKAIGIYNQMIKVAEQDSNLIRMSIYNNNCALAYSYLRDFSKAKYHMLKNLEANLKWQGMNTTRMISTFNNLASICGSLNQHNEAEEYFQKTKNLIIKILGDDNLRLSEIYLSEGDYYISKDHPERALNSYKKALSIAKSQLSENDDLVLDIMQEMGKAHLKLEQVTEASKMLNKTLKSRSTNSEKQHAELASLHGLLYDIDMIEGRTLEAKAHLEASFAALHYNVNDPLSFEKIGIPIRLTDPLWRIIDYYGHLVENGNESQAVENGLKYIDIAEAFIQYMRYSMNDVASRQILAGDVEIIHKSIVEFYYNVYQINNEGSYLDNAFTAIEKSNNIFLYESRAEHADNAYTLPQSLQTRRKEVLRTIAQKQEDIAKLKTTDESYNEVLEQLNEAKNELYVLFDGIKINHPDYYNTIYNYPTTSIEKTQKAIGDQGVFVSYFFGSSDLFAILIDNQSTRFIKIDDSEKIINNIYNTLYDLKSKEDINRSQLARLELYEDLIVPLNLDKYARANISSSDALSLVPFELLTDSDTKLISTTTFAYQYSATLMIESQSSGGHGDGVLAMAPIFENSTTEDNQQLFAEVIRGTAKAYLPETEEEVNMIGNIFDYDPLLRDEASKVNFLAQASGRNILHLATHGYNDPSNANRSCLYFANTDSLENSNSLYAEEIAQMKLNADLVTLSACNTGTGRIQKGEGVASLGRAFAYAGCPNQVISLWAVNDKTTTQLMTYFYQNLDAGQPKATALKNAKQQYLQSAPNLLKHPFYWAGFVYYGEDSVLEAGSSPLWGVYLPLGLILLGFGYFLVRGKK